MQRAACGASVNTPAAIAPKAFLLVGPCAVRTAPRGEARRGVGRPRGRRAQRRAQRSPAQPSPAQSALRRRSDGGGSHHPCKRSCVQPSRPVEPVGPSVARLPIHTAQSCAASRFPTMEGTFVARCLRKAESFLVDSGWSFFGPRRTGALMQGVPLCSRHGNRDCREADYWRPQGRVMWPGAERVMRPGAARRGLARPGDIEHAIRCSTRVTPSGRSALSEPGYRSLERLALWRFVGRLAARPCRRNARPRCVPPPQSQFVQTRPPA